MIFTFWNVSHSSKGRHIMKSGVLLIILALLLNFSQACPASKRIVPKGPPGPPGPTGAPGSPGTPVSGTFEPGTPVTGTTEKQQKPQ